jgi:pyruvate formate lyase activating enzyme
VDGARHREATGVPCAGILSNLEALCAAHGRVWMRIPVIPGFNDDESTMVELARLAGRLPSIQKVCLLPYHRLGADKHRGLGRPEAARDFAATPGDALDRLAGIFGAAGLAVSTGG